MIEQKQVEITARTKNEMVAQVKKTWLQNLIFGICSCGKRMIK